MRNATVIINVAASATVIESQIAFLPNTAGKMNIARIWKSSVLKNDIAAEIAPLLSAVKNAEPKMLNPIIKYDVENIRKAYTVRLNSSPSYPT